MLFVCSNRKIKVHILHLEVIHVKLIKYPAYSCKYEAVISDRFLGEKGTYSICIAATSPRGGSLVFFRQILQKGALGVEKKSKNTYFHVLLHFYILINEFLKSTPLRKRSKLNIENKLTLLFLLNLEVSSKITFSCFVSFFFVSQ